MNGRLGCGRISGCLATVAMVCSSATARADVDVGKMVGRWRLEATSLSSSSGDPFRSLSRRGDGAMRLLVTERARAGTRSVVPPHPGMLLIRPGLFTWTATPEDAAALLDARADLHLSWSAPRHIMLDQAVPLVRADVVHGAYGLTGLGVAIGIVDTGLDVRHADLRDKDGASRIAWLLDMSHSPVGLHPELEETFGCTSPETPCAIYSGVDLNKFMSGDGVGDEPRDTYGHGTHVASLAAGNGFSSPEPKYVGMAPNATIIAVRATRDDSGIVEDPDILSAVKFIFDVADQQLKLPAVVNLSLGGDFGAHDGTSRVERELAEFVGPDHPGHALVVAAGNSGVLYDVETPSYPSPFGIHTVAHVPLGSSVRVPVLIGESAAPESPSQLYIWVATRPSDWLKVGLESDAGSWIRPVNLGGDVSAKDSTGEYTAEIQNGITESDDVASVDHAGACVIIEGPFAEPKAFTLQFEGHGTASIWVQAAGGIDPVLNEIGALMPAAQREGTISIPATSTALIAVGAALDRFEWENVAGVDQLPSPHSVIFSPEYLRQGTVLPFSAAGPSAVDALKPDIVAPGGWVAGAMSVLADPRTRVGEESMFEGTEALCLSPTQECLLVDEQHALSTGTSMASPIVAGAVALLLESNPALSQPELLLALQAGAKSVGRRYASASQLGAGLLDVENALLALHGVASTRAVDPANSWIGLGNSYAHPDPHWPIAGLVHLRDDADRAVDVDVQRLALFVKNGRVLSDLERHAPGYYRFTVAAEARTARQTLRVELHQDEQPLLSVTREIALDRTNTPEPIVAGRGCAVQPRGRLQLGLVWIGLGLGIAVTRRRHRRQEPRPSRAR